MSLPGTTWTIGTDLCSYDLTDADLRRADLTSTALIGPTLARANLRDVIGLNPTKRAYAKSQGAIIDD